MCVYSYRVSSQFSTVCCARILAFLILLVMGAICLGEYQARGTGSSGAAGAGAERRRLYHAVWCNPVTGCCHEAPAFNEVCVSTVVCVCVTFCTVWYIYLYMCTRLGLMKLAKVIAESFWDVLFISGSNSGNGLNLTTEIIKFISWIMLIYNSEYT